MQKTLIDDPEAVGLEWVEVFSTVIPGEPQQVGSKVGLVAEHGPRGEYCPECKNPLRVPNRTKTGRIVVNMIDDNRKSKAYMEFARGWLAEKWGHGRRLISTPVATSFRFYYARPAIHFGTGKNAAILKDSAPAFKTTKPDESKLIRCIEDCMTGNVWVDDSLVVARLHPSGKFYTAGKARTEITLYVPARFAHLAEDNF